MLSESLTRNKINIDFYIELKIVAIIADNDVKKKYVELLY